MADHIIKVKFQGDESDLERASDAAQESIEQTDRAARDMAATFDSAGSTASTLAGGFGDLGGALSQMGGPLGAFGSGMEALGPTIMGVTGAADLLSVATNSTALAQAKSTASMVAGRAAAIATTAASKAMTAGQWLLNAALSANPIGLVVIALAGLAAGIALAWQHSETFREIVSGAFTFVSDIIQGVWRWVSDNWPLLLAILTGPIGLAVLAVTSNFDRIRSAFSAVVDFIGGGVGRVVDFVGSIPAKIGEFADSMKNKGLALASAFWDGLKSLVGLVGGGITDGLKAAINTIVIRPINAAVGFINDKLIANANKVPFVDIPSIPKIPELAEGGIALSRTLAIIGENIHSRGEAVIPLEKLDKMLGSQSMPSEIVVVDADRTLIGRMRVEARGVLSSVTRSLGLAGR